MKKFCLLAVLTAIVSISISASNQFSFSENDTIRIHPNRLSGYTQQIISMETDAFCDSWNISFSYPDGLAVKLVSGVTPLSGMIVDYCTATGDWATYEATLNVSAAYGSIASTTSSLYGFWDYAGNGNYMPYGTVKWTPDTREMFSMNLFVDDKFRKGEIIMDCTFNSSMDSRGPILSNVRSFKRTYIWVGYEPGDLNGDGNINITDVTMLITALEKEGGAAYLDEWSTAAADFNGDGLVNITDATLIMNHIINNF